VYAVNSLQLIFKGAGDKMFNLFGGSTGVDSGHAGKVKIYIGKFLPGSVHPEKDTADIDRESQQVGEKMPGGKKLYQFGCHGYRLSLMGEDASYFI